MALGASTMGGSPGGGRDPGGGGRSAPGRVHAATEGGAEGPEARSDPAHPSPTILGSRSFGAETWSPVLARRFVARTLEGTGLEELAADAVLVVSELATNAVVHAHSRFHVTVSRLGATLRIDVGDAGATAGDLVDRIAAPLATSGRGLRTVAALARRWGVLDGGGGKVVWAELGA